jgi:hypothetical protein
MIQPTSAQISSFEGTSPPVRNAWLEDHRFQQSIQIFSYQLSSSHVAEVRPAGSYEVIATAIAPNYEEARDHAVQLAFRRIFNSALDLSKTVGG